MTVYGSKNTNIRHRKGVFFGRNEEAYIYGTDKTKSFGNRTDWKIVVTVFCTYGDDVVGHAVEINGVAATNIAFPMITISAVLAFGLPFQMANMVFIAIIRSDGNPQYAMKSMMIGAVINLVLDTMLIFVFDMGVIGAAIATKPAKALAIALSRQIVFLIPLAILFSAKYGLSGALAVADILACVTALAWIANEYHIWRKNGFLLSKH